MMKFALTALAAMLTAVGAARVVMSLDAGHGQAQAAAAVSSPAAAADPKPQPYAGGGPASIAKGPDGHFWAEANVDGHAIRFLVDTGATAVALTADDARRLGINRASLDYSYSVQTANGEAHAARVTLRSVAVAGARVDDVEAYVIDRGLETSLLGMTYLGRLSRFEATQTSLILRP